MTRRAPRLAPLSDAAIERLADALDAAGRGAHDLVLRQFWHVQVLSWLASGVPQSVVEEEMQRVNAAAAIGVATRGMRRSIEAEAGDVGEGAA